MDLQVNGEYHYMPSPMVIGIFELVMMRTGGDMDMKRIAKLFHLYLGDKSAYAANLGKGERVYIARALPHEESIHESCSTEVLDYEKATALAGQFDTFSIGLCSCRRGRQLLLNGIKRCDAPLETCSQFGYAADMMIRHQRARPVSRTEMQENLARAKEMGLVFCADNVKKNVMFICQCCGCCCNLLQGISKHGYANTVVTSSFIAETDEVLCTGCGKCVRACPINARKQVLSSDPKAKGKKLSVTDTSFCIGCGVCALKCPTGALKLVKRGQRVIHPENVFERIMLQCIERGTLQNQIFDNPQSVTHAFMRGFVGGFLKLSPVKRALMSDMLRSRFLSALKKGAHLQGKGWVTEM